LTKGSPVKSLWTLTVAGLFALSLFAAVTAEEMAALPDEAPVEADAGAPTYTDAGDTAGGGGAEDGPSDDEWIRVRAHVLYDAYEDLHIAQRSIKKNDLGLTFAQPSRSAQNSAEEKSWWATTEMAEVHFDLLGVGSNTVWLYFGAGARQSEQDFGTESVEIESDNVGVYAAGALGNFGEITDGVRLDWEARFTFADSKESSLDQIADVDEELEVRTMTYSARLVAVFDPALLGAHAELDGVRLQPYAGVLYRHVKAQETYTASSFSGTVGESEIKFDIESKLASDIRALGGIRLLGIEEHAIVDLEGSVGNKSYGAGLVLHIRF
jgi:hypothetical protein